MVAITNAHRRGVLLLVVLSVLTLFLMLGAAYVAVASRARKASRAFANNVVAATAAGVSEVRLLDEAFLAVARGTTALKKSGTGAAVDYIGTGANSGEDLLGDKYGTSTAKGRVTAATKVAASSAILQLTCTATSGSIPANVSDYAGRVVTLVLPGLNASTRILGASGTPGAPTLTIPGGPTVAGEMLSDTRIAAAIAKATSPAVTAPTIIINGREFDDSGTNEPYDGFDAANPLLARLATGTTPAAAVMYSGTTLNADNDGDGAPDSAFTDIGLPPIIDASGRAIYPEAAVLVVDLDGRLNVNAHGGATDSQTVGFYPTLNPTGSNSQSRINADTVPLYQLPRGAASGPADVSLSRSLVFSNTTSGTTEAQIVQNATYSLAGRTVGQSTNADTSTGRETPKVGGIEGRFGDGVTSGTVAGAVGTGVPNVNDLISRRSDLWRATIDFSGTTYVSKNFADAPGRYGSPWDVKGRIRIWVDDFGQPVYFKPNWFTAGTNDDDVVDDPYEVNLTRLGSRPGYTQTPAGASPADNLFTPTELEGLLRYFDPDSLKLPRRLVAMNERNASSNRLLLTTESWDTPAIVGDKWRTVVGGTFASLLSASGLAAPNRAQDFFSAETIMGHKLDLNRPFHDTSYDEPNDTTGTARRQMFARHLYCLMIVIAHRNDATLAASTSRRNDIARQIAQYAINVVDWRDGDSVMTRFAYDPAFTLGSSSWSPGANDYVWGCERPELLITETLAWHDRRTDDLATDPSGKQVTDEKDANGDGVTDADDDFDQHRRPRGAFFIELYSPWAARTATYVSGSTVVRSGSNTRGEPVPAELQITGSHGFNVGSGSTVAESTISLNKVVSGCPVWRLASVRGDVQGGTGIDATTKNIVDPSAPNSTAQVDRVFYFAEPTVTALTSPTNAINGRLGGVFWTTGSATVEPSQSQYVVVGTNGIGFDYRSSPFTGTSGTNGLSHNATVHLRFDGPSTSSILRPATLSEPINSSTSGATLPNRDPYETLSSGTFTAAGGSPTNIYDLKAQLASPIDKPVDSLLIGPSGNVSESFRIANAAFIAAEPSVAGKPLLMFNGTHENFAIVHLQRLADPTSAWNISTNPYITVDSMAVDLTVVNTGTTFNALGTSVNQDEPGMTPYDITNSQADLTALTWLQTQKSYRYQSVERGGKKTGTSKAERDIWSSRVNEAGTVLASGTVVVSGTSPYSSAAILPVIRTDSAIKIDNTTLLKKPTPAPAILIPVPAASTTLTGTTDHTLREYATQTERDSRPARFIKTPNSEPQFPWLAWPNRPFGSVVDLALVPVASPFELPARHSTAATNAPTPAFFHLPRFFESTAPESPWGVVAGRNAGAQASLLDFVHIPSPFTAIYTTVTPTTSNTNALQTVGLDIFPLNQISNFREPGRVNVNTIPDRSVWRGLFGAVNALGVNGDPTNPDDPNFVPPSEQPARDRLPGWNIDLFSSVASGTSAGATTSAAKSVAGFFQALPAAGSTKKLSRNAGAGLIDDFVKEQNEDANFNGTLDAGEDVNTDGNLDQNDANKNGVYDLNQHRNSDQHAYFRYQTMRQLSNIVTTRSNVFGVWVTIRYVDSAGNPVTPERRNRAFYIFDRSIPVAYEKGENHNVRDAILLRRIIQ